MIPYVAIVPYTLDGAENELVRNDLGLDSESYKALSRCL